MRELSVVTAGGAYPAIIAPGLRGLGARLARLGGLRNVVVVTDERVAPLWADAALADLGDAGHAASVIVAPVDEARKDVHGWWAIVDGALRAGVDRRSVLLALGGGVVGDLTGFAAATLLRGIDVVQVPTTLLAMVDSAVGGKTGFNHEVGKNLVGAFWQPRAVWAPLEVLATLPERERRAGLGEVVKHALIEGPDLLAMVGSLATSDAALPDVIARCVQVKADVVASDTYEAGAASDAAGAASVPSDTHAGGPGRGGREVLNLGHTVGHAIEREAGYGAVLHGEAVAVGLVVEAAWAEAAGLARPGLADEVRRVLTALGLPTSVPADLDRGALVAAMRLDKKVRGAMIAMPVCERVGRVVVHELPLEALHEVLVGGGAA